MPPSNWAAKLPGGAARLCLALDGPCTESATRTGAQIPAALASALLNCLESHPNEPITNATLLSWYLPITAGGITIIRVRIQGTLKLGPVTGSDHAV